MELLDAVKKGYEAEISELRDQIRALECENKQALKQRSIAVSNLQFQISEHKKENQQSDFLRNSEEFWSHQVLSKRNSRERPYKLVEYYDMHMFRYVKTSLRRFVKCLCDLDLLKIEDYRNEFLTMETVGATDAEIQAGNFFLGVDNTYITEVGMLRHSGIIRHSLLHTASYQESNPIWYKRSR